MIAAGIETDDIVIVTAIRTGMEIESDVMECVLRTNGEGIDLITAVEAEVEVEAEIGGETKSTSMVEIETERDITVEIDLNVTVKQKH